MSIEIVDVAPPDMPAFVKTSAAFFGEIDDEEQGGDVTKLLDRGLLARADGEDAGTAAVIHFQLTLPGGARVPMDGVTWVAVSPPARRRGVLRAMMDDMRAGARERGIPALGLGASESSIYRRFGYGVRHIGVADITTAHAGLRVSLGDGGRVRMQPLDGAPAVWMDVQARQADRVGRVDRPEESWRRVAARGEKPNSGKSPLQVAVHLDANGDVDGFVNYRLEQRWPDEIADGVVHVSDISAVSREAHVALWQHVLAMDLMEHVHLDRHWLDDPIQHLLLDPRRLRVRPHDDLHLCVTDVVAMLEARRYSRDDALVLEVRDPMCADVEGRYRLEGGLDGATASRTGAAPDLVLEAAALGSLMLGDVSAVSLSTAGLIQEERPGAVRRAAAMFWWSPRPWLNYMF